MTTEKLPADIDAALLTLPIRPANLQALTAIRGQVAALGKDRDDWRREFELYASSWLRRLGGRIFNKRHRIDALAMTTEHQRIGYQRALAAGLIGEAYGSGGINWPLAAQGTADLDKLREVVGELAAYTSHHIGCALYQQSWASGAPRCSCGLDTIKATLTAAIAPQVKTDQKESIL